MEVVVRMGLINGLPGGTRASSSDGVQVRGSSGFGVNGRVRLGEDSYTFSQLRNGRGDSSSLLRLNYALGTLASAQDKLGELLGFTETLIDFAEKAGSEDISNSQRQSLDRRFQATVKEFQDSLSSAAKEGVDFLDKDELSSVLQFAGINTEAATRLSATFERLAGEDSLIGFENVPSKTVQYTKRVRIEDPRTNFQVTDETNNAGTGISFAEVTNSSTDNVVLTTEATYSGNSSGSSVTGTYADDETQSLLSDLSGENQRVLAVDDGGLTALVATGDGDKTVLQRYILGTNGAAPTLFSTEAVLDTSYDSVTATLSPTGTQFAYLSEDSTTVNYFNGSSLESYSVTGGTIDDIALSNSELFFTSNATSIGANGAQNDLFSFDTSVGSPTPTRIAATDYSDASLVNIEEFTITNDGTKVAFTISEGETKTEVDNGLSKELVILERASGDFSRFEDATGRTLAAPAGNSTEYQSFDFDVSGDYLYVAQREGEDQSSNGVARFDVSDVENPTFYDVQATGVFDGGSAVDDAQDYEVSAGTLIDVNGDGNLDLVGQYSANIEDSGVVTYLGDGNGGFGSAVELDTETASSDTIGVGDLNGDSFTDLVVKTDSSTASVFFGSASGTFSAGGSVTVTDAEEIRLVDLDGDNNLDLVTTNNSSGGSVEVRLGAGDGTFGSSSSYAAEGVATKDVQLVDVNGDNTLDLVTSGSVVDGGNNSSTIGVRIGNGSGGFGSYTSTEVVDGATLGGDVTALGVQLADINGDGALDAVTLNESTAGSSVAVSLGNGDGTFQTATTYATALDSGSDAQIRIADLDNDADLDVIINGTSSGDGFTQLFRGDDDGTLTSASASTNTDSSGRFFALGDLDNDGALDAVQGGKDLADGSAAADAAEFVVRSGIAFQAVETGTFVESSATISSSDLTATTYSGTLGSETTGATFDYTDIEQSKLADINGDGILDSVTSYGTGVGADGIAVSLGNPDGTFQSAVTTENTGIGTGAFTTGDFDGDGKSDIVVADGTDLYLYSGNGDGTFNTSLTSIASGSFNSLAELASADINGDGNLDIISSGTTSGNSGAEIFFGNGSGTFATSTTTATVAGTTAANNLAVADVTDDGEIDIVLGAQNGTTANLTTFINDGGGLGTLSSTENVTLSTTSLDGIAIANTGVSSEQDLIVSSTNGSNRQLNVFSGDATGAFTASFSESNASEAGGTVQAVDVNNDGELDIVQGGYETSGDLGVIRTFLATGGGSFNTSTSITTSGIREGERVLAGDFNGDGAGDILYNAEDDDTTGFITRTGGRTPASTTTISETISGDVDGDGVQDLISVGTNGTNTELAISLGNSDGTFDSALTSTLTAGGEATDVDLADLDGDGNLDLVFSALGSGGGDGVLGVSLGNGDGTFGAATTFTGSDDINSIRLSDVTGDGDLDLIAAGEEAGAGEVRIFEGNGDGTFVTGSPTTLSSESVTTSAVEVFDIDGDGDNDLITAGEGAGQDGYIGVRLNDGTGTFSTYTGFATGSTTLSGSEELAVADLNGDGETDIVLTGTGDTLLSGAATIFTGDGTGSFSVGDTYVQESKSTTSVTLDDLNRDGILDLITGGENDAGYGEVSVRFGRGDGTFTDRDIYQSGADEITGVFTNDIDGDGDTELISTQNQASSQLQATVRDSITGEAGTIVRTGAFTAENVGASSLPSLFGFTLDQGLGDEYYAGSIATNGQTSGTVGALNDVLLFQLTNEIANSGGEIINPTLVSGDVIYSTTADYNGSNPNGVEGFTRQELSFPGFENVKIDTGTDNAILDVDSDGNFALIQDFTDDSDVYSLKVYNLQTDSVAFEIGQYSDTGGAPTASGALSSLAGGQQVAFTREGDTNTIFIVDTASPATETELSVTDGSIDARIVGSDSSLVFTAQTSDFGGDGVTRELYIADSYSSSADVTRISLGANGVDNASVSTSSDGSLVAAADTASELFLIENGEAQTVTATGITNVQETAVSSDGSRLALLQQDGSDYTISLYARSGTELSLLETTTFTSSEYSAVSSLSINGDGTQVGAVANNSGGFDEFFKAIDTTITEAQFVEQRVSTTVPTSAKVNPLQQSLSDTGNSLLASENLTSLKKQISEDIDEITTILDELSGTIQKRIGGARVGKLSSGLSSTQLQSFAQSIAERIRSSSVEEALLTNRLDPQTALDLLG
ncbi:VCBS repeat-containing protein [bacterium]|nr:VCBS repeat-containing protein [bacterium]